MGDLPPQKFRFKEMDSGSEVCVIRVVSWRPFSLLTSLEELLPESGTWSCSLHAFCGVLCLLSVSTDVEPHASLAKCSAFSFPFSSPQL